VRRAAVAAKHSGSLASSDFPEQRVNRASLSPLLLQSSDWPLFESAPQPPAYLLVPRAYNVEHVNLIQRLPQQLEKLACCGRWPMALLVCKDIACGPLEMRDGGAVLIRPAPTGAVWGRTPFFVTYFETKEVPGCCPLWLRWLVLEKNDRLS
jgi:hypothetical protein